MGWRANYSKNSCTNNFQGDRCQSENSSQKESEQTKANKFEFRPKLMASNYLQSTQGINHSVSVPNTQSKWHCQCRRQGNKYIHCQLSVNLLGILSNTFNSLVSASDLWSVVNSSDDGQLIKLSLLFHSSSSPSHSRSIII